MKLIIEPYRGAAPLSFGLSRAEAVSILGEPLSRSVSTFGVLGEELDFRGISLAFNKQDRVAQLGFDKHFSGSLLFEGMDVLRDPIALASLIERDGSPYEWVGFVMLLNLGIRLGGYHETADEGRTVSLFERGRYDSKVPRFHPFAVASPRSVLSARQR